MRLKASKNKNIEPQRNFTGFYIKKSVLDSCYEQVTFTVFHIKNVNKLVPYYQKLNPVS